MTRKSAVLFCLALWTLTPGCLQLPWRGSAPAGEPTKIYEAAPDPAVKTPEQQPVPSTPTPSGPAQQDFNRKMPQPPPINPLPSLIPPLDVPPPRLEGEGTKKQPSAGVLGTVTTAQMTPSPTNHQIPTIFFQAIPPLGEKKLSTLARAIDLLQNERHAEALEALKEFDEPTQEFFLRIAPVLVQIAKKSINDLTPQQINNLNAQLVGVLELLRTRSELLVAKMIYCKQIKGFADYVALPDDHVFLSRGELVQVYVELKNFASVKTKDGDYLTKLTCSLEVTDKNDKRVSGPYTIDKTQTTYRRSACVNDYYGNFSFYAPSLPEGTYKLTIQIVDETIPEHRRVARKSLVFRVTPVANPLSSR